ncbi:MAG: ABC transporter substrate-binding protein [Gammaproteobacteria bacterium]|nr:MAG: ABC transporter substrate-binding protein [Gammaproteobacteria bacterium]
MTRVKRWRMVFVIGVILLFLVAACTPPAPPSSGEAVNEAGAGESTEPQVLRVWITWGDNPAQLQELFDRYTAATGIRVEVNSPVEDDKVIAGLSGNEPPDVLVLGGPDSVGTWAREGLVTPLDDYLATGDVDVEDIFDAPLSQCLYQGNYFCLPWGTDTYALFWNKDLFEEAGLDPDRPPQTLEELAEYAQKLTKVDENGNITQVGFIPDFSWSHLDLYTAMMGGYWYSDDGTKITFTSDPVVNALKWEQQFYCDYNAEEVLRFSSAFGGYASPDNGFYAGKIAMQVEGEWQPGPNFIQKYKPELFYGVAPLPPPADHPERANTNLVSGTVALIPAGVKDKDAAWKLLAWMQSPEILADEMVANFNLPSSGKAAQDPRFHENEKFEVFLNLMSDPNARAPILTPINAEVGTELGQIEEQVLHTCADPLPLLQAAQDKLQPELDKALSE